VLNPAAAPFEITSLQLFPANILRLRWNSTPGCTYRIEMSDSMAAGTWSTLAADIPATGASTTQDVTLPPALRRVFVRVVIQ
jgi:hypothetical protein